MNFFKKPGRILLLIMIVLAVVYPYRVHMYKTKIDEIKSGKLKINDIKSMICSMLLMIYIRIPLI